MKFEQFLKVKFSNDDEEENLVDQLQNNLEDDELENVFHEKKEEIKVKQVKDIDEDLALENENAETIKSAIIHKPEAGIFPVNISKEMSDSFLEYAMSVIMSRAIPDARDGLKPVHRRILFGMYQLGISSSSQHKKSARIVGDVLGKFHPHGDSSVYYAMVRMAQTFSMRYPLVDGHGNFGSIDGDSAAAMRYTEVRLTKLAEKLVENIKENTVDFIDNYDGSEQEPQVLPTNLPNLLLQGTTGIAVGMATSIPPHNLGELIDATVYLANFPEATISDLMNFVKGPDFPTGAKIINAKGIKEAYETGRGSITIRSKYFIEEYGKQKKQRIIVSEIPYEVKKSLILEKISQLKKDKKIEGIEDFRDETSRKGIRIVIEIKPGFYPEVIMANLFKFTNLQVNFSVNIIALVKKEPKLLNLKGALQVYLDHQFEVTKRKLNFNLDQWKNRIHILQGLKIAIDQIDLTIKLIRSSKNENEAREKLQQNFHLSQIQAKSIVEMRLARLTNLAVTKLLEEINKVEKDIFDAEQILNSSAKLTSYICQKLIEIKEKFADLRKTEIDHLSSLHINKAQLISEKKIIVLITEDNYLKTVDLNEYRLQKRGGVGILSLNNKNEDKVKLSIVCSTHDDILFFDEKGKVYKIKAFDIEEKNRYAKGVGISRIIPAIEEKNIVALINLNEKDYQNPNSFLVNVTKKGIIKKTSLDQFLRIQNNGKIAFKLNYDDQIVDVKNISLRDKYLLITSNKGKTCTFLAASLRSQGRNTVGVKGIQLEKDSFVQGLASAKEKSLIFTLGKKGFGKFSPLKNYRITSRNKKGVKTLDVDKAGDVVYFGTLQQEDEVFILTKKGMTTRILASEFAVSSRSTKGTKLINLKPGDKIISVSSFNKNDSFELEKF